MSIFKSIKQAQQVVKQLSQQDQINPELLGTLSEILDTITRHAHTLPFHDSSDESYKPEMKSGCYKFPNEKGFFCPNCYDNTGKKSSH